MSITVRLPAATPLILPGRAPQRLDAASRTHRDADVLQQDIGALDQEADILREQVDVLQQATDQVIAAMIAALGLSGAEPRSASRR